MLDVDYGPWLGVEPIVFLISVVTVGLVETFLARRSIPGYTTRFLIALLFANACAFLVYFCVHKIMYEGTNVRWFNPQFYTRWTSLISMFRIGLTLLPFAIASKWLWFSILFRRRILNTSDVIKLSARLTLYTSPLLMFLYDAMIYVVFAA